MAANFEGRRDTLFDYYKFRVEANPHIIIKTFRNEDNSVKNLYAIFRQCCSCGLDRFTNESWNQEIAKENLATRLVSQLDMHCIDCYYDAHDLAEKNIKRKLF